MSSNTFDQNTRFFQQIYTSPILIVDDMRPGQEALRAVLENEGFKNIQVASNGYEALYFMERTTPKLIISDLLMPEMDGFTFCKRVRKEPKWLHLPIIFQTAMTQSEERLRAFEAGASDLMLKPINPKELIARVTLHLRQLYAFEELYDFRERIQSEMEAARNMQYALMPSTNSMRNLSFTHNLAVSGYFEPSSEISGDLWGVQPINDYQVAFFHCDFAGHGVKAAINTFRLQMLLQGIHSYADKPSKFVEEINTHAVHILSTGDFATFFYGVIDIEANTLTYSAAGAPPPLLHRRNGSIEQLDTRGIPLGITDAAEYPACTIPFNTGDTLFNYSDALVETPVEDTMIDDEELCELSEMPNSPWLQDKVLRYQDEAIKAILRRLGIFDGNRLCDDLTLSLISRL
ncbi:MAG: hypothetical protein CMM94_01605 [Rickettsiales bacterium]|nr:hypothetical protein [Rickettsiales bacterium]